MSESKELSTAQKLVGDFAPKLILTLPKMTLNRLPLVRAADRTPIKLFEFRK